jgi:hypothetical protein
VNWSKEIAQAATLDGVLAIMNEYLIASAEDFRDSVPPGSTPACVICARDLEEWQGKLVEAVSANAARATPALLDLGYLLLHALARAIELEHLGPACGATHDQAPQVERRQTSRRTARRRARGKAARNRVPPRNRIVSPSAERLSS